MGHGTSVGSAPAATALVRLGPHPDDQGATDSVESVHDRRQVRAVVGIDELLDGACAGSQAGAKLGVGDTLLTHGRVQSELRCDEGWNGDEVLARLGGARDGNLLVLAHMRSEDRDKSILGHLQGLFFVCSTRQSSTHIREGHIEPARVFGMQVAWIGVFHRLPLLPINPQVSQHCREQPAAYL